jgi:hypothetical protein
MGDREEARRWLETAIEIDPGHEEARRLLARCQVDGTGEGRPPVRAATPSAGPKP